LSAEQESVSLVVVAQRSFFFFLIFRTSSLSFSVVELDSLLLTVLATMASIFFFSSVAAPRYYKDRATGK
jgi:hypothetical protein